VIEYRPWSYNSPKETQIFAFGLGLQGIIFNVYLPPSTKGYVSFGGLSVLGVGNARVLWNFCSTQDISIDMDLEGSILLPSSSISVTRQVSGVVVAKSVQLSRSWFNRALIDGVEPRLC